METREEIQKLHKNSIEYFRDLIRKMGPFVFMSIIVESFTSLGLESWVSTINKILEDHRELKEFSRTKIFKKLIEEKKRINGGA